uniref:Uncharacterized protein n=1 Tax=Salix viminalis TaxID=40686 RepID=A0A6N2K9V6_SALVM
MDVKPSRKRPLELVPHDGGGGGGGGGGEGGGEGGEGVVVYKFKILLPNGMAVIVILPDPKPEMWVQDFIGLVKREYTLAQRGSSPSMKKKRTLNWESGSWSVEDENGKSMRQRLKFKAFEPHKCHILRLHDGSSAEVSDTFEDIPCKQCGLMVNGRKRISVDIMKDKISIFDTGPGMDASDENSIVKWYVTAAFLVLFKVKTDLAHHNPFTIALKNFSHKTPEKEKVNVDISRDDKLLSPSHLEKEYEEWILEMHSQYDTEVGSGEDDGVLVVGPTNKIPGISSDVVRVRDTLPRKGTIWKRGQKIKVLKGAGPGFHNKNVYLTLEHILIEGVQGDAGGKPLDIAEENGCVLSVKDGEFDIRSSISIPISVIDSGKCQIIGSSEWNCQLQKQVQKAPSTIEVLGRKHCRELGIDGGFPAESTVEAGCAPPAEIVAVVRPVLYISSSHSKSLDQKYIAKTNLEMSIEVKIRKSAEECQNVGHIYSARVAPSSRKGFNGFYPTYLKRLSDKNCKKYEKKVTVKASREVGKWKLLGDIQGKPCVRVGSPFPSFSIGCLDIYGNRIPFKSVPEITNVLIVSDKLDRIRPKYEATLVICPVDELIKVSIPCQVLPGSVQHITGRPQIQEKHLLPGFVVKELVLEMLDAHDNHVGKGVEVQLNVDGFCILDNEGSKRKVDKDGCIDLSGVLKVTAGFERKGELECGDPQRKLKLSDPTLQSGNVPSGFIGYAANMINLDTQYMNISTESGYGLRETLFYRLFGELQVYDTEKHMNEAGACVKHGAVSLDERGRKKRRTQRVTETSEFNSAKTNMFQPNSHPQDASSSTLMQVAPKETSMFVRDEIQNGVFPQAQSIIYNAKKLQDDLHVFGMKIKHHEDNIKFLKSHKYKLDDSILDLQVILGKYHSSTLPNTENDAHSSNPSEEETTEQILLHEKSAAGILCQLKMHHDTQTSHLSLTKDVLGVVATLGKVDDDNLSRLFSEYLGVETMLAIVCKTYEGVKALETYDKDGQINKGSGFHALGDSIGKELDGRYLALLR